MTVNTPRHLPNSTYNAERDKFWESRAKKEQTGSGYDKTDPEDVPKRRGPPKGHTGVSHSNKAERTVVQNIYRCRSCGGRSLQQIAPKIKMAYDFADNDSMQMECVAYVIENAVCNRCNAVSAGTEPTTQWKRRWGQRHWVSYWSITPREVQTRQLHIILTCCTVLEFHPIPYGMHEKALRDLLEGQYKGIMDTISQAPYIQMDESWIKINGKKGMCGWLQ